MACLGIRYGSTGDSLIGQPASGFLDDRSGRVSRFNHLHFLSKPNFAVKSPSSRMCTAATGVATAVGVSDRPVSRPTSSVFETGVNLVPADAIVNGEDYDDRTNEIPGVSEKFDEWMRNSVTEIVKNIRQAPLLVQIYADGVVKTKKAVEAEDWPDMIREIPPSPDGIILVEELREEVDPADSGNGFEEAGTKAFGVLIQGKFKGRDRCKSSCYLLKTSSVNGGMGSFCTHFCLMKVRSFGKSAASQLSDCWLLQ